MYIAAEPAVGVRCRGGGASRLRLPLLLVRWRGGGAAAAWCQPRAAYMAAGPAVGVRCRGGGASRLLEDEVDLAEAVAAGLRQDGYAVDVSNDGDDALYKLSFTPYDLVLLDLNLPDVDGLEVCRRIRADGRTATPDGEPTRVLMLTARDRLDDRVAGLDEGADDYLTKPFEFPELQARVRSLLRRGGGRFGSAMEVGGLRLDPATREATYRGEALDLTAKEFSLLRYFMLHPGQVLSAEHLLEHVWDEHADPFTNTVRVTISNLRGKLAQAGGDGLIETVVGSGYRLREE